MWVGWGWGGGGIAFFEGTCTRPSETENMTLFLYYFMISFFISLVST